MKLTELNSFRLSDAVKFHNQLNPVIFDAEKMDPVVRKQLLIISQDFMDHLGVSNLDILDIVLTGSNAAYTYTDHSDLDLHIIVNIELLKNDEVYRELFNAKKTVYNDTHDIKIHGYDVELYVEDSREPAASLGSYSVENDRWIKFPSKRRSNFDESAARHKFIKLVQLSELALRSDDVDKLDNLLDTIRKYRQSGLDSHGEFGPENLAFKALRSQGIIKQLYDHRENLHDIDLSLAEETELNKPTLNIAELASLHRVSEDHIRRQLLKGIGVELEHTDDPGIADEIARDHIKEDPNYYTKLGRVGLEEVTVSEDASGYVPSKKEKNDPRFKTALTVDIKPDSIKNNAKKLGLGNISRSGVPPTASASGKF